MAKDKKSKKVEEKVEKTEAPEFKYGVDDIAEELGIKPASVRVQLRNKGIEKAGKKYGWNSRSELKEVIAQLKSGSSSDEDDDEKPAKKAKGDKKSAKDDDEKPAKKAKGDKKSAKAEKAKKAKKSKDEDEEEDDD